MEAENKAEIKSSKSSPQQDKKNRISVRLQLQLTDSTDRSFPEFSYLELLGSAKKSRKKEENVLPQDGECDVDEIRSLAKKFEEKYAPKGKKKAKKTDRVQDLVDVTYGYDATDSFVDDSEAYDELVPADWTTEHGGFYINMGELNFRPVSSGDEKSDSDFKDPKKKKTPKKKNKEYKEKKLKEGKRCLSSEEKEKTVKKIRLNSDDKEKKVKHKKSASSDGESSRSKEVFVGSFLHQEKKIPSPAKSSGFSSISLQTPVIKLEKSNVLNVTNSSPRNSTGVSMDSGYSIKENDDILSTNGSASVMLPDGLPPSLILSIQKLIEAARKAGGDGKCKFFNMDVNRILLQIETDSRKLNCRARSAVYDYLALFLPCTKDTLVKRAKNLFMQEQVGRLREPLVKLRHAVETAMPEQVKHYEEEMAKLSEEQPASRQNKNLSSVHAWRRSFDQKPSSESVSLNGEKKDESVVKAAEGEGENDKAEEATTPTDVNAPTTPVEEKGKRTILPKRFVWKEDIRALLCDVVRIKVELYLMSKSRSTTAEEALKGFLETEVRPIWPKGWMTTRILYRESKQAHCKVTSAVVAKARKVLKKTKDGESAEMDATQQITDVATVHQNSNETEPAIPELKKETCIKREAQTPGPVAAQGQPSVKCESQTQHLLSIQSQGQHGSQNQAQSQPTIQKQGQVMVKVEGQPRSLSQMHHLAQSEGQLSSKIQGQHLAKSEGLPSVKSEGQSSVKGQGQPSTKRQGQNPAQSEGQPSSKSNLQPSLQTQRPAPVQSVGRSSVQPPGQTPVQSQARPSVQTQGQTSVQSQGRPTQSQGRPTQSQGQPLDLSQSKPIIIQDQGRSLAESQRRSPVHSQALTYNQAQTQVPARTHSPLHRENQSESQILARLQLPSQPKVHPPPPTALETALHCTLSNQTTKPKVTGKTILDILERSPERPPQEASPSRGKQVNLIGNPYFNQVEKPDVNRISKPVFNQTNNPDVKQVNKPVVNTTSIPGVSQTTKPIVNQISKPVLSQFNKPVVNHVKDVAPLPTSTLPSCSFQGLAQQQLANISPPRNVKTTNTLSHLSPSHSSPNRVSAANMSPARQASGIPSGTFSPSPVPEKTLSSCSFMSSAPPTSKCDGGSPPSPISSRQNYNYITKAPSSSGLGYNFPLSSPQTSSENLQRQSRSSPVPTNFMDLASAVKSNPQLSATSLLNSLARSGNPANHAAPNTSLLGPSPVLNPSSIQNPLQNVGKSLSTNARNVSSMMNMQNKTIQNKPANVRAVFPTGLSNFPGLPRPFVNPPTMQRNATDKELNEGGNTHQNYQPTYRAPFS